MNLLYICAALFAGEWFASLRPAACGSWPLFAIAAALAALLGHGFRLPGWRLVATAFAGAALFFLAIAPHEEELKHSPWLRDRPRRARSSAAATPLRRAFSCQAAIGIERDAEASAVNRAILLGERWRLKPELRRAFVESGSIHVFAISGLHVMIVARTLMVLLMLAFVPQRLAGAAALPPLWLYVYMIGAPPSAVRAAAMASFYLLAPVFWRRPDALRAWSLTFLAVYLADPRMVADVGCRLSFTVMLALILAVRPAERLGSLWAKALFFSFAAWAAGAPIAANAFGRFTPGGIVANLALLPAATLSVATGVVGALAGFVSETAAAHLNNLAALVTRAMTGVSRAVADLGWANFEVEGWGLGTCAAWYSALLLTRAWICYNSHTKQNELGW